MRGKTVIRCAQCHVGSDKRLILVFKAVRKCMSCAAIDGVLKAGYETEGPEEAAKRLSG